MPYPHATHHLRQALLGATELKALAGDDPDAPAPPCGAAAAELVRAIQVHLDRVSWNQDVDPQDFVGHFPGGLEPLGGLTADSYHALAFSVADKIFQDISYVLSCAARDAARRGSLHRLFGDDGMISAELVEKYWRYVREYLFSSRCPDFTPRAEEIFARMEQECSGQADGRRSTASGNGQRG